MRRLAAVVLALLATGCKSRSGEPDEQEPDPPSVHHDVGPNDAGADDPDDPGEPPPNVEITDANRFVQQDLERFLEAYPDAVRKDDEALLERCIAGQCLEHGASASLGPFLGEGIRYLVPLWLRGCLTGSADACMQAGRTYQGSQYTNDPTHEGWDKADLQARFRLYIDRACKLDETECEQWADFTLGDESPPQADVDKAIERLNAICDDGEYGACAALARHAPEYPAIGDEKKHWGKACAFHPKKPNRECSRYAELLFASGSKADRSLAQDVLDGACTPDSDTWKRDCSGDVERGEEVCGFIYVDQHGAACLAVADTLSGEAELRLTAAMCVDSLLDEVNAQGRRACERAQALATKRRKPKAYMANLAKRMCAVERMECLSETFDLRDCDAKLDICSAQASR